MTTPDEQRETVADWVMAQLAMADPSLTLSRTNHGEIEMVTPDGRTFTVTVERPDL